MSALAMQVSQSKHVKLTRRFPDRSQHSTMPERVSGHLLREGENPKPAKMWNLKGAKDPNPPEIFPGIQIWG